jgi:hypothetical protein
MGFGIRIAPGLRISASSRGLRAGIGPRAARIHVGSGRTSLSTGAGPLTLYGIGAGGRRRAPSRRTTGHSRTSLAAIERQARAQTQTAEVAHITAIERHVQSLHCEEFPRAAAPVIPPPPPVDVAALTQALQRDAVATLPWWRFQQRREARQVASWRAPGLAAEQDVEAKANHTAALTQAQEHWSGLLTNDPGVVLAALEVAFEGNESPAVAIDCQGATVSVVVLFPSIHLIPERRSAVTPAGKPTLKPRTKTERNELYVRALGSAVLATAKEAFAVAPAITTMSTVVIRHDGTRDISPLYTGRLTRHRLDALDWNRTDPATELMSATDATIRRTGPTKEVQPLDLTDDPQWNVLAASIREALLPET